MIYMAIFLFINEAMCRLYGYSRNEMLGSKIIDYLKSSGYRHQSIANESDIDGKIYNIYREVYRTETPQKSFVHPIIRKDGSKANDRTFRLSNKKQTGEKKSVFAVFERMLHKR